MVASCGSADQFGVGGVGGTIGYGRENKPVHRAGASAIRRGTVHRRSGGRRRLRRIHVLAWRDVEHPDAGGSEIYVRNIVGRWAATGLDVTLRTGIVPNRTGSQRRGDVHVVRRGGRVTSLVRGPASEVVRREGQRDGLVEIWHGVNSLAPLWARGPRIAVVHHVGREARYVLPIPAALAVETMERRVSPLLYARTPIVTLSESSRADLTALGYRR